MFDYENHYKKLISDLTHILTESIVQIPEPDKDTLAGNKITQESKPVTYPVQKRRPPSVD